ncbi:MAG: ABC transporter permease, partial [Alphaproteobacteria bacterium]
MISRRARSPLARTTLVFVGVALVCVAFADLAINTADPWAELARLMLGVVTPDFYATDNLGTALLYTFAFAILGVAFGNVIGFALALVFFSRSVRIFCAMVRAVHELFWALIFL